jgi:catechol 2,3-dioxygenase-like lactoylglutathione lyase family enzyme
MRVDHVVYGTGDLDAAAARVEACLGLTAVAGGRHDELGTHNRIVPLADGSFIELLAVADPQRARRSPLGAALQAAVARGDGLLGWAVAVDDIEPVAARLQTTIGTVGRQGMTARLTGVPESLAQPGLPFFIERRAGNVAGRAAPPTANTGARIGWLEIAVDARRLAQWLCGADLGVRVVGGEPGVRAIGVGDRELRTSWRSVS